MLALCRCQLRGLPHRQMLLPVVLYDKYVFIFFFLFSPFSGSVVQLSLSQLVATSRYPTMSHTVGSPWQQQLPSLLSPSWCIGPPAVTCRKFSTHIRTHTLTQTHKYILYALLKQSTEIHSCKGIKHLHSNIIWHRKMHMYITSIYRQTCTPQKPHQTCWEQH